MAENPIDRAGDPSVLVLFAHPAQHHSVANVAMAAAARDLERVTFVDLYAENPRHDIDIQLEQQRLLAHDTIVLQFPFYWYSTPSILKEWQDLVLQYGFAYGDGGTALAGKKLQLALTTGSKIDHYTAKGLHGHTLRQFLAPLEQTTKLCRMKFLTPFVLYGALGAKDTGQLEPHVTAYVDLLNALADGRIDGTAPNDDTVLSAADVSALTGRG